LDISDSGKEHGTGCCVHGNIFSGFMKCREFLD